MGRIMQQLNYARARLAIWVEGLVLLFTLSPRVFRDVRDVRDDACCDISL